MASLFGRLDPRLPSPWCLGGDDLGTFPREVGPVSWASVSSCRGPGISRDALYGSSEWENRRWSKMSSSLACPEYEGGCCRAADPRRGPFEADCSIGQSNH
jgi:hypothetical protein